MICSSCEGKNRDGARFCTYCGAALALRCAVCDTELVPGARFCDSCGTPVDETVEAPAVAARKVVTVLFGDLTGSTALEERMDAESVRSIIDRFYVAMRTEVERHGGRIVKFTGDGVMAAFGVPDVHEDDAARAIDAAVAMRAECEQLASDLSLDLSLKIGINTGEVVVSATDDDVVGDAVNVASRFEGAASAGEVLVGEETWRLTRGTSRYEPIEALVLKGKSEPVRAYRLLSVDERTADSAAAPFVGRDPELARLLAAFDDAVESNTARLVTIVGSPGLGKTRLARELTMRIEDRARVRWTRCDPAGSATFAPIADALREAAGITEAASEEEIVAALAERIPEDDPDRDRIAQRAAAILGVGQAGSTEETFWALRRLIEAGASIQPVVLVLDDLHWAEPLLLDLVEHLAEWIRSAPVLLVGTGRPELRDIRPSLVEGGRAAAVIALEGLDQAATAQLALNLLGAEELPSELLAKIPASTEGNPLFVRELVRMLVDDGVLLRTADGWSVTVDVEAIEVPPTIQSLLSARVDRLRSDERTVVELASVVGKEFFRGAIYDLAPSNIRDLVDGCLESLRRKELVEPVGTYWIDEPVYRFHHVLIRDAAYRRLLKESRAELHERVAAWLEDKTAGVLGEHDELLGYHLEQAHEYKRQLGRPDEALGRRAGALLGAAARRALDRDDLPAAATLSGRALDTLPADDDERSELLLIRCEALLSMRDVRQGAVAVTELQRIGDTPRLAAWATCFAGHLATITTPERLEETEVQVAEAATELAALGDQAGAAKAHTVHAMALGNRGRFAESETVLDAALTAARAANDRRRITATLGMAPHAALWGPNPVSRAGGRCLDIVRLLRITTGSPAVEATSLRCQAVLEALRGRADAARRMLRSACRTLTDLGLQREILEADQFAGIIELVAGDPAAAIPYLQTSHEGCREFGIDILAAQSAALLARAHLSLGETEEAEALVAVSDELANKDIKTSIDSLSVKAELLARRGEFDQARRTAEQAVAIAERTDALYDHGNAYRGLAAVLRAAGDADGAKAADDRARALFERKGATALIQPMAQPPLAPIVEPHGLTNSAVRLIDRRNNHVTQGDAASALALYADDCVDEDRRAGLHLTKDGKEEIGRNLAEVARTGNRVSSAVIATRGDRLALLSTHWEITRSDYEVDHLTLCEVNEQGQIASILGFDAADLDTAFDELEERYAAIEPFALINLGPRIIRAMNERDWSAYRRLLNDGLTVVDHRPVSLGEFVGAETQVDAVRELTETVPDLRFYITAIQVIEASRVLTHMSAKGQRADGSDLDVSYLGLYEFDSVSLTRMELFGVEDLQAALDRFDELSGIAKLGAPELINEAACLSDRLDEAFQLRDWAAVDALVTDEVSFDDRRRGLGHTAIGRRQYVGLMKVAAEAAARFSSITVAIRGERLTLKRMTATGSRGPAGLETEFLSVQEWTARGCLSRMVNFDPEDIGPAMAELDYLFIASEGAAHADLLATHRHAALALNRHDWDELRSLIVEDFRFRDHRAASLGALDREGWIQSIAALVELSPTWRAVFTKFHAIGDDVYLTENLNFGRSAELGAVEFAHLSVAQVRDGRWSRMELFPVDAMDAATRLFEDLAGRPSSGGAPPLRNKAAHVLRRAIDCMLAQDWDRLASLYHENVHWEDARPGLQSSTVGREAVVEHTRVMGAGATAWMLDEIATRGDRLVLVRGTVTVGTFDIELLGLTEIDESGLITFSASFDADDLDTAFAELEARYITGDGEPCAEVWQSFVRSVRALNERDWDGWRREFANVDVFVDHRPASLGRLHGVDEQMASVRTLVEVIPDVRWRPTAVVRLDTHGGLVRTLNTGTSPGGGTIEMSFLVLFMVTDGVRTRQEFFPEDRLDAALARFEELGREAVDIREASACVRAMRLWSQLYEAADWDRMLELHRDDFAFEDRRAGVAWAQVGADAHIRQLRVMADIGTRTAEFSPLGARGDRLVLGRWTFGDRASGSGFETPALIVNEIDGDGFHVAAVVFESDDLDAAFDELDDRYVRGEGAAHADVLATISRLRRATNARDWDATRDALTGDAVVSDHRPVSLGEMSRDAWIESVKAFAGVFNFRSDVVGIHRIQGRCALLRWTNIGRTDDGDVVESPFRMLIRVRDGRIDRMEPFSLDDLSAAQTRFDELAGDSQLEPTPANECSRTADRMCAAFGRREWDVVADCFSVDAVNDDRRTVLRDYLDRREAIVAGLRELAKVGAVGLQNTVVATRGERLVLSKRRLIAAPGHDVEAEILVVEESDDGGRIRLGILFDPDDLDTAVSELDAQFTAGEAKPFAEVWRSHSRALRAMNERDWDSFRREFAEDYEFVDHRPASLGRFHGVDEQTASARMLVAVIPDVRWCTTEVVRLDANRGLVRTLITGTSSEGGTIEMSFLVLFVTRDGVRTRQEFFPEDQLDAALARFEELGPSLMMPSVDNACVRVNRLIWERYEREDWDGIRELYTDDHVVDDRRAGVRATFSGADANIENLKASFAVGVRTASFAPIAVRGESLALIRHGITGSLRDTSFQAEVLVLNELAGDGRISAGWVFDPDDLDAALAELEDRYIAGEGRAYEEILRLYKDQTRAYNARDWDAFRACFHDDYVMVDHRPAGAGTLSGPDEQVQYVQILIEMAPDARLSIPEIISSTPDRMLLRQHVRGTTTEGAEIELSFLAVALQRDGRHAMLDVFPIHQLDSALERYEALATPESGTLENLATRQGRAGSDALKALDWDAARSLLADDVLLDDRRQTVRSTAVGPDAWANNFRTFADLGLHTSLDEVILAIRGDRLALVSASAADPDGNIIEAVTLLELDAAKTKTKRLVWFDVEDLDAAFLELDETFAAGEGASCAEIVRRNANTIAAINERNWSAYAESVADGFVMVDHRPVSLGEVGVERLIEAHLGLVELIPDLRVWVAAYEALEPTVCVSRITATGHTADGDPVDLSFINVVVLRDGSVTRTEFFPADRLDDALARFGEVAAPGALRLENAATRNVERFIRSFNAGDREAYVSDVTDDLVYEDRRRGLSHRMSGRAAYAELVDVIAEMRAEFRARVIATRGHRLAIAAIEWTEPKRRSGSPAVEALHLIEVDEDGRLASIVVFDSTEMGAAFAELDERFIAGEGAPHAPFVRMGMRGMAAFNAGDWDAYASLFSPDLILVDHQVASAGTFTGRDAMRDYARMITQLAGDIRERIVAYHRLETHGGVVEIRSSGKNAEGGPIEFAAIYVGLVEAGEVTRFEIFPAERLEEAITRFDELGSAATTIGGPTSPDNEASRSVKAFFAACSDRDWPRAEALCASGCVGQDRRSGLGSTFVGRDTVIENMRAAASIGAVATEVVCLATRGQRLTLDRIAFSGDLGFEADVLQVAETDEHGQTTSFAVFDPDDIDDAFAELDLRYADGEAAPYGRVWEVVRRTEDLYNARDWDQLASTYASGFSFTDHRPAGSGVFSGSESWISFVRRLLELMPDVRTRIEAVYRLGEQGGVFRWNVSGTNEAGGAIEIPSVSGIGVREGLITWIEQYPVEQVDLAIRRFEELDRTTGKQRLENLATANMARFVQSFNARDREAFASDVTDDLIFEDRRPGLGNRTIGREAYVEQMNVVAEFGAEVRASVVATRGERLALMSVEWFDPRDRANSTTVEMLRVEAVDADGRLASSVAFESTDTDPAFAELDEIFIATEGAPFSDVLRLSSRAIYAMNERDWSGLRATFADDLSFVDHRPASLGESRGGDRPVEALRALLGLMATYRIAVVRYHALSGSRVLGELLIRGHTPDGSEVEVAYHLLGEVRDGVVAAMEVFPVERLDEALARFDELGAHPEAIELDNAARRVGDAGMAATEAGDWESVRGLLRDDVISDDRRRSVGSRGVGADAYIRNFRTLWDLGMRFARNEVVAIRGDNLALGRSAVVDADGNEIATLTIVELAPDGLVQRFTWFDADDHDAAFVELDERFLDEARVPEAARLGLELLRAYNGRDWDRFQALLAEDFVLVDHRPVGRGTTQGRKAYVALTQGLIELLPDIRMRMLGVHLEEGSLMLATTQSCGTDEHGNAVEYDNINLLRGAQGRISRLEFFSPEQFRDASVRFDELSGQI